MDPLELARQLTERPQLPAYYGQDARSYPVGNWYKSAISPSWADATSLAMAVMGPKAGMPQPLAVARKLPDGTLQIGKPGQIHSDLLAQHEIESWSPQSDKTMGFATPEGKFLTREQALARVMKDQPEVGKAIAEDYGSDQLDAQQYAYWRERGKDW